MKDSELEYDWLAVSDVIKRQVDIQDLFNDGWEFCGGALRRPKEYNEPRSNRT